MLDVENINKSYENQPLLCGLSFTVQAGETICLLGPSGSGKSTLLRIIAGLESPEQGRICWDGLDISNEPAHRRNFGLVFQDYALFPHLKVAENVSFGPKMQNLPEEVIASRVKDVLGTVNLSGFEGRPVTDLSGGEQQRVALARALATRPRLLMLDEPLGALDRTLRDRLLDELRSILGRTGIPAIYVTHDQEEASVIADRVMLLHEGKIIRSGPPAQVWRDPGSVWAARFLGLGNLVEGRVLPDGQVRTDWGDFRLVCRHQHAARKRLHLLLRPEGVRRVVKEGHNTLEGEVVDILFHQGTFKVTLSNGLYCYLRHKPKMGSRIRLHWLDSAVQCLECSETSM